jgi:hypothetical protein
MAFPAAPSEVILLKRAAVLTQFTGGADSSAFANIFPTTFTPLQIIIDNSALTRTIGNNTRAKQIAQ